MLAQKLAVGTALSWSVAMVAALTVAFAVAGLLLSQRAYSSGLGGSLALLTLVNPVTASVIGIALLGEGFQYGETGTLLALAGAGAAAGGVILLSRPQHRVSLADGHDQPRVTRRTRPKPGMGVPGPRPARPVGRCTPRSRHLLPPDTGIEPADARFNSLLSRELATGRQTRTGPPAALQAAAPEQPHRKVLAVGELAYTSVRSRTVLATLLAPGLRAVDDQASTAVAITSSTRQGDQLRPFGFHRPREVGLTPGAGVWLTTCHPVQGRTPPPSAAAVV